MIWVDDGAGGYFDDTGSDGDNATAAVLSPNSRDDDCYFIDDNCGADDVDDIGDDDAVVLSPAGSSDYNFYNGSVGDDDSDFYDIDDNNETTATKSSEKSYIVLTEADIRKRQDEQISSIISIVPISKSEASLVLYHFKWNASQLLEQWFSDEENIRRKVGLLSSNNDDDSTSSRTSNNNNITCGICFDDDLSTDQVRSLSYGEHYYCTTCWTSYIRTSIKESGPGCLSLRCPEPKCPAAVGQDMVCEFASARERKKYFRYLVRSYVEFKTESIRWCPKPGCNNAVEFERSGDKDVYDVRCDCSHVFCFKCAEEPHRPVECKIVVEWINKNSSEGENTKWILAYCKNCPKCKQPIDKNSGCNHMTCRKPCGHEFCWYCLGDWKNHGNCNRYEREKTNEESKMREMAKQSIVRYSHYYERWASNHRSREKAIEDLSKMQTSQLPLLSEKLKVPETQLQFILDAWEQIVQCRRVLKWTYAYGFYSLEHEDKKRALFEFVQGEAETGLETLHHCAEVELSNNFLADEEQTADLSLFRMKLAGLTKVTGTYFENLVRALENGLSEVVSKQPSTGSSNASTKAAKGPKRMRNSIGLDLTLSDMNLFRQEI